MDSISNTLFTRGVFSSHGHPRLPLSPSSSASISCPPVSSNALSAPASNRPSKTTGIMPITSTSSQSPTASSVSISSCLKRRRHEASCISSACGSANNTPAVRLPSNMATVYSALNTSSTATVPSSQLGSLDSSASHLDRAAVTSSRFLSSATYLSTTTTSAVSQRSGQRRRQASGNLSPPGSPLLVPQRHHELASYQASEPPLFPNACAESVGFKSQINRSCVPETKFYDSSQSVASSSQSAFISDSSSVAHNTISDPANPALFTYLTSHLPLGLLSHPLCDCCPASISSSSDVSGSNSKGLAGGVYTTLALLRVLYYINCLRYTLGDGCHEPLPILTKVIFTRVYLSWRYNIMIWFPDPS
ncbi:unnamed protein product [Protopolystoma xenopodis]|uniref:Uncharacterized protein n=1 Tax=Protopolystoma xenopodis TaxID=117903 RepID=A0A3S4ZV24_9PLAT|nr:unnamed protein product [Protopolystoma xenopodis]